MTLCPRAGTMDVRSLGPTPCAPASSSGAGGARLGVDSVEGGWLLGPGLACHGCCHGNWGSWGNWCSFQGMMIIGLWWLMLTLFCHFVLLFPPLSSFYILAQCSTSRIVSISDGYIVRCLDLSSPH